MLRRQLSGVENTDICTTTLMDLSVRKSILDIKFSVVVVVVVVVIIIISILYIFFPVVLYDELPENKCTYLLTYSMAQSPS